MSRLRKMSAGIVIGIIVTGVGVTVTTGGTGAGVTIVTGAITAGVTTDGTIAVTGRVGNARIAPLAGATPRRLLVFSPG
jgi:hypothetical protein